MPMLQDPHTKKLYLYDDKDATIKEFRLFDVESVPLALLPLIRKCDKGEPLPTIELKGAK